MKDWVEIIAGTERRRKFSDAEKAAILAEADEDGVSVRQIDLVAPPRRLLHLLASGAGSRRRFNTLWITPKSLWGSFSSALAEVFAAAAKSLEISPLISKRP